MDPQITRLIELPEQASFFLFGARQTGKTTLINQKFKNRSMIFDLLDREVVTDLRKNIRNFREAIIARDCKKITHVIVDEIQKFPELLDEVQYIMTAIKNPPYFILTGSSARKLKRSGVNMLGGRAWSFSLAPLTHEEIQNDDDFTGENFPLKKILEFGSLPPVFLEFNSARAIMMLKSYYDTYIKEEIRIEALVRNLDAFSVFLEIAANDNGQLINYSNIAQDLGINHNTVKEYYQILVDTLMGFYLRPYASSTRKRLVKSPKFYFFDTGVLRAMQGKLSLKLDYGDEDFGRIFEHYIIKEIIDIANYKNKDYKFSFFRTEAGAEVDLIIEKPNAEILAVEIKASDKPKLKNLRGLKSFQDLVPKSKLYCVSLVKHRRIDDSITIIPWREFFEILDL